MVSSGEQRYLDYLGTIYPKSWQSATLGEDALKEHYDKAVEHNAELREFCEKQGCSAEDRKMCAEYQTPCSQYCAFVYYLVRKGEIK